MSMPLYWRHFPVGLPACAVALFPFRCCCWPQGRSQVVDKRARWSCRPNRRRRLRLLRRQRPRLPSPGPQARRRWYLPRPPAPAPGDARIRAMADRHTGIGFDQLLVIEPARDPACVAAYSIRNADGSIAEQCGNGARCIGAWLHRAGDITIGTTVKLQSPAGVIGMRLDDASTVTVDMGEPAFEPAGIPFDASAIADTYPLDVDGERVEIAAVSMGNPHAVMEVTDVHDPRVEILGPRIT